MDTAVQIEITLASRLPGRNNRLYYVTYAPFETLQDHMAMIYLAERARWEFRRMWTEAHRRGSRCLNSIPLPNGFPITGMSVTGTTFPGGDWYIERLDELDRPRRLTDGTPIHRFVMHCKSS